MIIIHKGENADDAGGKNGSAAHNDLRKNAAFGVCPFVPVDQQQGNQKRPEDILVDGIKGAAADCQIEGELGQEGKQKKPAQIPF